jgi:putative tricarboxylic transport membrane protein
MTSDRISGGLFVLLGLAVVAAAWGFYVPYQYEPLGPKAMPYLVGGLLILCGVRLMLAPGSKPAPPEQARSVAPWWRQWLLGALLLGYGFSYEPLGFILSSLCLCSGLAWMCGARLARSLGIAIGLTLASHLLLVQGLGLQLPPGWLEGWL